MQALRQSDVVPDARIEMLSAWAPPRGSMFECEESWDHGRALLGPDARRSRFRWAGSVASMLQADIRNAGFRFQVFRGAIPGDH